MNRLKYAGRNVLFGILNKAVAILGPFSMRTIVLYKLGADYVGLSGLFTSLLQVLNFAELGFSNAIVYSMYRPVAEGNKEQICGLLNYFRRIYKIVSLIILVLSIITIPFLSKLVNGPIPSSINLYILFAIYVVNLLSGYMLYAYKSSLLLANQRNDIDSLIQTVCNLLMYLLQGIILILFKNYYLYILMIPICTIGLNFYRNYVVTKMYPDIVCKGYPNEKMKEDIKKKVAALAGHKIGLPITNSIDSLVVSATLGLTILAIYDNYCYVFQAVGTILTICYTSITPTIGNSIITENTERNYKTFLHLSFLNMWVVSWCAISLLVLYQNFMMLWTGKELLLESSVVVTFSVAFYVAYMRFITTTYKDACGMWIEDRLKPYVICFGNLILDLFFVKVLHWGVLGVVVTTLCLRIMVAVPWETAVLFKNYFKKSPSEYLVLLGKWAVIFAIASFVTVNICNSILGNIYGVKEMILRIIIVIFVPNVIFVILNYKSIYFNNILRLMTSTLKK